MTPDDTPRVLTEQELQALRDDMESSWNVMKQRRRELSQTKANDNLKPAFIGDEAGFFEPPMIVTQPKNKP
tara:strand:- start:148 stop:360 length:213 start_codon:yes stop_codon:yes gene_type:complete